MKKSIKTIFLLISIFVLVLYFAYHYFFSGTDIDVRETPSITQINADLLVKTYVEDEEKADSAYTNKVFDVVGKITEVSFLNNRNTLILQGNDPNSGVICDMDPLQHAIIAKLSKGDKVRIKGVCKGFLKDVIMLNCILISNVANE